MFPVCIRAYRSKLRNVLVLVKKRKNSLIGKEIALLYKGFSSMQIFLRAVAYAHDIVSNLLYSGPLTSRMGSLLHKS